MQIQCAQCGYIDEQENFLPEARCPVCHFVNSFRISIMESPSSDKKDVQTEKTDEIISVEAVSDFGVVEFFQTFFNLVRFPREFFSQLPRYTRILRPFLIAYFIYWIVGGITMLTTGLEKILTASFIQSFPELEIIINTAHFRVLFFIFFPVGIMAGQIIMACLFHLLLKITFQARESLLQTLRLFFYLGFLELFKIVPVIGSAISGILRIVFLILGTKTIHSMSVIQVIFFFLLIGSLLLLYAMGFRIITGLAVQYLAV